MLFAIISQIDIHTNYSGMQITSVVFTGVRIGIQCTTLQVIPIILCCVYSYIVLI